MPEIMAIADRWIVNYVPQVDSGTETAELRSLVRFLSRKTWVKPVLILVDECDMTAPMSSRNTPLHYITKRGGKWNVWALAVTQHPADVAIAVPRQSEEHVYFQTDFSVAYWNRHHLPGERITALLAQAPPYHYVRCQGGEVSGPFGS